MKIKAPLRNLALQIFVIALGSAAAVTVANIMTPAEQRSGTAGVVVALGILLAFERTGAALSLFGIRKDIEESHARFEKIVRAQVPTQVFQTPRAAHAYVVEHIPQCQEVFNTTIRVGQEQDSMSFYYTKEDNRDRTSAMRACIKNNGIVHDVISENLLSEATNQPRVGEAPYYRLWCVNPRGIPITNFMILKFENGDREVLFGWSFSRSASSPAVFLSRNSTVVDYFVQQFAHLKEAGRSIDR